MKHKNKIIIICIIVLIILSKNSVIYGATKREGIENFPDTYKPYLKELQNKHSNWKFTALYTENDWNYVINNENIFGKNLVPISYSDSWKNTKENEYNIEIDSGWVDCSKQAVEYTMDPRNFLNEVRIFQFEQLSYSDMLNNKEGIEKILYGTEFYNRIVEYKDSSLNTIVTNEKYSEIILSGAKISGVSPYHLASRIKQEVGPFLSHNSISGEVRGYEGLYNFYNIGATSSTEPMGAIINGLKYARDGKNASEAVKNRYKIPWNTKEIAVRGGAIFIGSSYINIGQDTIYFQKFDVNNEKKSELFNHQYMTNILAPYSESKSIYNGYVKSDLINLSMNFVIPVYENMPELQTESPNIQKSEYIEDNTKMYADVSGNLNVRSGPGTSYEIIKGINRNEIITRIAKGNQSGELWDRVILADGIVGYVFQNYLKEYIEQPNLGELGIEIDKSININGKNLSGIDYKNNTVQYIKEKIKTTNNIEVYRDGNLLEDDELVGSGNIIKIKDNQNNIILELTVILYGDVNGDGKINSVDLLVLQRHILEIEKLSGVLLKSGNINKNGKNPSSIDSLLIQRHILGIQIINQ